MKRLFIKQCQNSDVKERQLVVCRIASRHAGLRAIAGRTHGHQSVSDRTLRGYLVIPVTFLARNVI
jgi:hypothetical protein